LYCSKNQLSATALNAMMTSLNNYDTPDKWFNMDHNPGTNNCNQSIAEKKGWREDNYFFYEE
jgi:hypothetical protein